MDSDLAESISALKTALAHRGLEATFGPATLETVSALGNRLRLPRRYRTFLEACDPLEVETVTPAERIRLIPASELLAEQQGFALDEQQERISEPSASGWRPSWVIVARSTLLGDPYFLDTADPDAEGDCPLYTAMSGTEVWQPKLCSTSFALFLRILAISLEVAGGFDVDDYDTDNEQVFRESLGPRIREYDPRAFKEGHWT